MIEMDRVTVLFEMRRTRLRRRMLSGGAVGGVIVSHHGVPYVAALQSVSLRLPPGSRVAVIGANGAGKTTLLRTMAGIYEPQGGTVRRGGRISTLFSNAVVLSDYETGRENLELAALLRGYSPKAMRAQIDRAAEAAGLGSFLDQPLVAYSEGMKTRLGFAVAAMNAPDVMLVDEVLGAGDIDFLKSARGLFDTLFGASQTVVMASHVRSILALFCDQAVWLDHGRLAAFGPFDEIADQYDRHAMSVTAMAAPGA